MGPDSFGQVDIQPEDIGLPRHAYDDLVIAPQVPQSHVLVSASGSDFVPVQELESQRHIQPTVAADELGFYYVGATDWIRVYRSDDGVEWTLTNLDELSEALAETIVVTPDWTVGFDVAANQLTQSVDGGRFVTVPAPAPGLTVGGVVETDFGVAVVWQDFTAVASAITQATTGHDGYTVERNFQGAFTVTDPNGVVLIDERGDTLTPEGGVVIDTEGNMQVFDENGERQLLVEPEDLFGVATTVAGSQYVGWSTDGDDWKFAELEQPAGPWVFSATPNGLFGVNVLDLEQSLVIDWPAEFDS